MGSRQSTEESSPDVTSNHRAQSYVQHLIEIQHKNFLHANSMETKEVLLLRRNRILHALKQRKAVKPYAIQLMEARVAAQRAAAEASQVSEQQEDEPKVDIDKMRKPARISERTARILQLLATRRRKVSLPVDSPSKDPSLTDNSASSTAQQNITTVPSTTSKQASRTSIQESSSPVVNRTRKPLKESTPQKHVRTDEPKPSTPTPADFKPKPLSLLETKPKSEQKEEPSPSNTKIKSRSPSPPKLLKLEAAEKPRLSTQPPPSVRQSIIQQFSKPNPQSVAVPKTPPSPPSIGDLIESIKAKQYSLLDRPAIMGEKMRRGLNHTYPVQQQIDHYQRKRTDRWSPTLEYGGEDCYDRRHIAEVDRLTDSLIAGWDMKTISGELLKAEEQEISLLSYGEPKNLRVPHRPIAKANSRDHRCQGYVCSGGTTIASDGSQSSMRWRTEESDSSYDSRWGKRCKRHQPK